MSAYNPLNGLWTASNYDLLTTILREEWGFEWDCDDRLVGKGE